MKGTSGYAFPAAASFIEGCYPTPVGGRTASLGRGTREYPALGVRDSVDQHAYDAAVWLPEPGRRTARHLGRPRGTSASSSPTTTAPSVRPCRSRWTKIGRASCRER